MNEATRSLEGVRIIRPDERSGATAQSAGMRREAALSAETTGAQALWMGLATTPPGTASAWHHHGDCETGIYVVSGRGRFSWGPGGADSAEVGPGDFLAVAPHAVHREEALGDEPFVLVVARGCGGVLSVDVEGPQRVESRKSKVGSET
ncbi:MAG: cupin domain-containing protein [Chloroflexota bacterium]|nr:cupin domain-containing protein [Chloroflexota bacterium]